MAKYYTLSITIKTHTLHFLPLLCRVSKIIIYICGALFLKPRLIYAPQNAFIKSEIFKFDFGKLAPCKAKCNKMAPYSYDLFQMWAI